MNYYDETAAGYPELHREEQIKKIKIIKQNIGIKPGEIILDLGAGTGFLNEFFPDNEIYSVDPSEKLLEQNKNQIKFKTPAEKLPFPDNTFDWVISVTAIHHFDLDKAIQKIKRVGKNNFVITVLKKAKNKDQIINKLKQEFKVKEQIEEDKDIIFILENYK
ncbi:class I SAM-dependent methyltransferase [Candidatus Woesearchaeota archaeon]|nr:class I SAM-dependent methyltransferase [Candidatus Woesearchaeota archaeon]